MNKKFLSLFLALVLVLGLVACQPAKKPEQTKEETTGETTGEKPTESTGEKKPAGQAYNFKGKTITFAGLDGGYGKEGWNKVLDKFQELTGAKVERIFSKAIEDEVSPKFVSGQAPDVNYISVGRPAKFTEAQLTENQILEINDVFDLKIPGEDKTPKEKLLDGFLGTTTTNPKGDDKTYLAPINMSPTGMFFNSSLFKDGGGQLELPKTVDEMVALKGKVKDASVFTYPTAGYFDGVFFGLIGEAGGPELFDKLTSYDSKAWETEAKPVFEAVGKLLKEVNPNTVAQANKEGFTKNQLSVMQNKSLFMPNGTWIVGEMKDAQGVAEGFKWGFMAQPALKDGGDRYAYTFTEQVWIPKGTKEPEVAKALVAFLYSDEAAKLFVENGGAVMPTKGTTALIKDPAQKLFYEVYNNGAKTLSGGFKTAPAVEGVSVQAALFDAIDSVAGGKMTVEEWHKGVVDAVKAIEKAIKAQ